MNKPSCRSKDNKIKHYLKAKVITQIVVLLAKPLKLKHECLKNNSGTFEMSKQFPETEIK